MESLYLAFHTFVLREFPTCQVFKPDVGCLACDCDGDHAVFFKQRVNEVRYDRISVVTLLHRSLSLLVLLSFVPPLLFVWFSVGLRVWLLNFLFR